MTTRLNEKIIVLNNTLLEVPEPEVSCKFLTARTPLIWELLASRNTEESVERNKEKNFQALPAQFWSMAHNNHRSFRWLVM